MLAATIVFRVNAGGSAVAGSPAWIGDTFSAPSSFSNVSASSSSTGSTGLSIDTSHTSIPSGTPAALFSTERWDPPTGAPLQWNFPVAPGDYEVRLYFAEIYSGAQFVNARVFDVSIENALKLDNFDIFNEVGGYKAIVKSFVVAADSNIDIDFTHIIENPKINAIEIVTLDPLVVYRENAGGPATAGNTAWGVDTISTPSIFSNVSTSFSSTSSTGLSIDTSHASIPSGTPAALFSTERWDPPTGAPLQWNFPVAPGDYEVRLYFAEIYSGAQFVNARVFDVSIENALKLDNFDIFNEVGGYKAIVKSFVVTADSNIDIDFAHVIENPKVNAIEIIRLASTGNPSSATAEFSIAPPSGGIDSSTYESSTFVLKNTSTAGLRINSVKVDLSTAIFRDMVFDPNGTAGDVVAKGFTVDSSNGIGVSSHSLTGLHDTGFDALQVNFTTFDPGKSFGFSIDVDPTSIRGAQAPGPSESGSVAGLELTGTTVTVNFSDGTTHTTRTYRTPNSVSASTNILESNPPAAPSISLLGFASTPVTVNQTTQIVRINGSVGSQIALLVTEGALFTAGLAGGGFDIDPFESNSLVAVREYFATVGSNGFVDVPIALTKTNSSAGLHAIVAGVKDSNGRMGSLSNVLTVRLDTSSTSALNINALTLINADTDSSIPGFQSLTHGQTINLANLPTRNLNIQATSAGIVGSIRFSLNGNPNFRIESGAPYALFGDVNGNYNAAALAVGNYALTATAYTSGGGNGTAGTPFTINFQVIDQPSALQTDTSFDNPLSQSEMIESESAVQESIPAKSDINLDGDVTPIDALIVINELKRRSLESHPEGSFEANRSLFECDVNGDGFVSPIDVLWVINDLSRRSRDPIRDVGLSQSLPGMDSLESVSAESLDDDVLDAIAVDDINHRKRRDDVS